MNYWVLRGNPKHNEPFEQFLRRGRSGEWWTRRPPRGLRPGDRIFIWASNPRLEVIGLAELTGLPRPPDSEGRYWLPLRYLTDVLSHPVVRSELRSNPILKKSVLFKRGPTTTVVPLTRQEGDELLRLVRAKNPSLGPIWRDVRGKPKATGQILPDVDLDLEGKEGSRVLVRHLRVERDYRLVRAKKEAVLAATGRLACEVCGFDFHTTYGVRGKGFCEVHHMKSLARGGKRKTRLSDLAVVCSNCHRMLHRGERVLTPAELRDLMGRHNVKGGEVPSRGVSA